MSIGKQIKKARLNKKLTQTELSEKFNKFSEIYSKKNDVPLKKIGTSAVSNWENEINDPDIDALPILCGILDIDANTLLELDLSNKSQQIYSNEDGYSFEYYNIDGTPFNELPKETQTDILKQAMEEKQKMILEETEQILNIKKELENIGRKD